MDIDGSTNDEQQTERTQRILDKDDIATIAKVYPTNELLTESGVDDSGRGLFVYPTFVSQITLRNHMFDAKSRGKRKARRRLVEIKEPNEAARGAVSNRNGRNDN
ncbi:hypothetical protein MAR_030056 [Mya arenaria]|uniref:Uncharacterized protein n=1 Tax=Mya arenaria TaxID=6604 RepID=A0ABY7DI55_MYAAR|nr:hypothetical protein MAR_030056 [Mya arenaria]